MNDDSTPRLPGGDEGSLDASNRLLQLQQTRNRQSRARWDLFAPHRQRVTNLLVRALESCGKPRPRVCLLGAGNCNDVDLRQLVGAEIHLVDVDEQAMRHAVRQQQVEAELHAADVSGSLDVLQGAGNLGAEPAGELTQRLRTAAGPELPGPFDVVASLNLLTQLVDLAAHARDLRNDEVFVAWAFALQERHLELLRQWAAPTGVALLITDVVSSLTCPDLEAVEEPLLSDYLMRQVMRGNFFTGANPWSLQKKLADQGVQAKLHPAWKWDLGPRVYLVAALEFRV